MSFVLRPLDDAKLTAVPIQYCPEHPERPPTHEELKAEGLGQLVFLIRPFVGADHQRIHDVAIRGIGKDARVQGGAAIRERVMRSVVKIEGMVGVGGEAIERLSATVYDQLPSWIITRLADAVTELNQEDKDQEGN